jgi:copper-binding protein NosD
VIMTEAQIRTNTFRNVYDAIRLNSANHAVISNNLGVVNIQHIGVLMAGSGLADIFDNRMHAGEAGIFISGSLSTITSNDFAGPAATDCQDTTSGDGTAGTNNEWTNNTGTSSPAGICNP